MHRWMRSIVVGLSLWAASGWAAEAPAPLRRVTLLHIADTHAQLLTHPEYMPGEDPPYEQMGGYARLKTAIDRARASGAPATILVDGGDTFQGSAPAAWSEGQAVLGPFNALDPDVCVPGNWEVVYGAARFLQLMHEVHCKVIAYNFHDAKTGQRLFAPSTIIDRGGVRVAFVGLPDPTTTIRQPPDEVRGLDSTRIGGLRPFVQRLKAESHPDLIVAVTHTGLTISRQIAREVPEFDVVLSAHTHERTYEPIMEGKTIVVEPGSMGSFLGRLDLSIGPKGGVVSHDYRLIPVRANEFPEDPAEAALVAKSIAPYRARMSRVVTHSRTPIARYDVIETNADNLVADAVREMTGADIGSTNGFRFAPPILAGPVTEGDLWSLLPLDARVKMGWITGKQLRQYLEHELELVFSSDPWKLSGGWGPRLSGVVVKFAAYAPPGHRLREVLVHGKPLQDNRRYTFAGCERPGEPLPMICRLKGVHDVRVVGPSLHQLLDAYLERHRVIAPRQDERAVAVDLPSTVFSQDALLAAAPKHRSRGWHCATSRGQHTCGSPAGK